MKNEPNKTKKTNVGADASVCSNSTKTCPKKFGNCLTQPAAITLVALVITIIILIILAGVTLNLALGQNGIFQKSKQAVDKYKDSAQKEQNEMDNLYNTLVGLTDGGAGGGGSSLTGGTYDNSVDRKCNSPLINSKPNENTTMQLVKYDGDSKEWVPDTEGTSWSYVAGTEDEDNTSSHWANAKVTIDNVESYFVWIPRFAYKITPKQSGQTAGKIDVVFLQGTGYTYIDEEGKTQTAKRVTDEGVNVTKDYVVHPAFTKTVKNGVQTYDNGEWKEELAGLWIGKYETSHTGCNADESSGSGNPEDKPITIKPGITSWRYDTIGNFYTAAKDYSKDLNSHMLKNSEWGAVAYLTHSKYGRNGHEISLNNNSNFITGIGSESPSESNTDDVANEYYTENGMKASSTGNEYGIYDLRGGAYEYVAAYYKDGNSSYLNNGSALFAHDQQNKTSDEYATAYTGTNLENDYKKGDATYETKNWNSDLASFVNSNHPFFNRGGSYNAISNAGVFLCSNDYGSAGSNVSFRVCLGVM